MNNEDEIEASDEIIKYYNRNGLGEAKYFIFEGIKVYPMGKTEEIQKTEAEGLAQRLHGAKEGVVVGG